MTSRPRVRGSENAPALGRDVEDERQLGLTSKEVAWARDRAQEGFSARSIARLLAVDPSTIRRAARRHGWTVSWGRPAPSPPTADPAGAEPPPTGASGAVSRPAPPPGPTDRPPGPVAPPSAPVRPAPARPEPGPPEDERSARLWVCGRCKRVGFDVNRGPGREWHTPETCEARMARLDRVLDDRPQERPPWLAQW